MKTPHEIARETVNRIAAFDARMLTGRDAELIAEKAIEADRAQRDIYELIAEALDDRVANDLYDDEQTERTKRAAARFRGEDGGWEDDLWDKYIGPMLDQVAGDYSRGLTVEVLGHLIRQMVDGATLPQLDEEEIADLATRAEEGLVPYIVEVDETEGL